jgi:uncharacterized protein YraI
MPWLIVGCATSSSSAAPGTATQSFVTATLPPLSSPTITSQEATLTAPPTSAPVPGTTTAQLNVRGEPSSASTPLGIIGLGIQVQILGKDPSGSWFQIDYAGGKDGKGWVTSQYIDVRDSSAILAVGSTSAGSLSGMIIQRVNVRRSPGTDSEAVGTLNPKDVVVVTGKDSTGSWLQIQITPGAEAKGWVAAEYVRATGIESLPIIAQSGEVVPTETLAASSATTATPSFTAAPEDNDSAESPAVKATFSPAGMGSLLYSSDLSAPQGDAQDWIGFTSYGNRVVVSLVCTSNGKLDAELSQSGEPVQMSPPPACGDTTVLSVSPRTAYMLRLSVRAGAMALEYVHYTLSIDGQP